MKTKAIQWSAISFLIIALGAGLCYWLWQPQTLVLGDGTKLSLLKVTYGKHHAYPRKDRYGHPMPGGTISTTNETLCLWVEQKHKPNQWPNYQLLAYDRANTACAGSARTTYGGGPGQSGSEVVGIVFDAFPRRGWLIHFRAHEWNPRNGRPDVNQSKFVIRNPAHGGSFAKWTPESLPIKREDDDVAVTLTRLTYDLKSYLNGQALKPNDPQNKAILAAFQIEQNGKPTTNWQAVQIETSDATGNRTMNRSRSNHNEADQQIMTYQWGLWPDEPAWKLRVEFSRQSNFSSDETWTVTGVPLTPGTMNDLFQGNRKPATPAAETTIGDTHLVLYPPIQLSADQVRISGGNMAGVIRIRATPPPEGERMTLLKMTDDQDRPVSFNNWGGGGGGEYRFALKKLGDAKTITLTLALHRSRYVEFTAKPQP